MSSTHYIAINDESLSTEKRSVLRVTAQELTFPLSPQDIADIRLVEATFDREENMAGLAAPQIGISKKIIVFAAPDSDELRKWRPDHIQVMPKTIWLNATYTPIGAEKIAGFEGCFSVQNLAGDVPRFTHIAYTARDLEGRKISGEAKGYLARVIQHEIDHTNGILFIDHLEKDAVISLDEYRKRRAERIKS